MNYCMELFGLNIKISSSVYAPAEDSQLVAIHLLDLLNARRDTSLSVLDMGCGTGFLGLLAATRKNVAEVFLCDINGSAVKLAEQNFELNKQNLNAKCYFINTDLFAGIPRDKKFDLLIFNAPYLPQEYLASPKSSPVELAWEGGHEGIGVADTFLKEAVSHISDGGEVLIVSSSFSNVEMLKHVVSDLGLKIVEERKKHVFFEDILSMRMRKA